MKMTKEQLEKYFKINIISLCCMFFISFISLHICNYFVGTYFKELSLIKSYNLTFYLTLIINVVSVTIFACIKEKTFYSKYKMINNENHYTINTKKESFFIYFCGLLYGFVFSLLIIIQQTYHIEMYKNISNIYEFYKYKEVAGLFFIIIMGFCAIVASMINLNYQTYYKRN